MANRIAREVAEALTNDLPPRYVRPTHTNTLIDIAKKLQRDQTRAARLRKNLRAIERDIRNGKRELKALSQEIGRGK